MFVCFRQAMQDTCDKSECEHDDVKVQNRPTANQTRSYSDFKHQRRSGHMILAIILVLLGCLGEVTGQSYHWSNGWRPGKRAQSRLSSDLTSNSWPPGSPRVSTLWHYIIDPHNTRQPPIDEDTAWTGEKYADQYSNDGDLLDTLLRIPRKPRTGDSVDNTASVSSKRADDFKKPFKHYLTHQDNMEGGWKGIWRDAGKQFAERGSRKRIEASVEGDDYDGSESDQVSEWRRIPSIERPAFSVKWLFSQTIPSFNQHTGPAYKRLIQLEIEALAISEEKERTIRELMKGLYG